MGVNRLLCVVAVLIALGIAWLASQSTSISPNSEKAVVRSNRGPSVALPTPSPSHASAVALEAYEEGQYRKAEAAAALALRAAQETTGVTARGGRTKAHWIHAFSAA